MTTFAWGFLIKLFFQFAFGGAKRNPVNDCYILIGRTHSRTPALTSTHMYTHTHLIER